MKASELKWEEGNNILIHLRNGIQIGIGIDDQEHFIIWLEDKRGCNFYRVNNNGEPIISINKNDIEFVNYRKLK